MYKKYLKYTIFVFLVNFLFILNASADLICQYEYYYYSDNPAIKDNKILITIDANQVKYKTNTEMLVLDYGKAGQLTLDNEMIITVKAKKDLKDTFSKFSNCSDSIGFTENIEGNQLILSSKCVDLSDDLEKCSNLVGTASGTTNNSTNCNKILDSNTCRNTSGCSWGYVGSEMQCYSNPSSGNQQTPSTNKTSIKFSTSDKITGVLGVNENGNYYLQIDGDSNIFTFSPSDGFAFGYKNKNYTIDPDTKDDIFKSTKNSIYLYALDAGMGGTTWLLSLNAVKDGYTTPNNIYGSTNYDFIIDNNKTNLFALDFKGICSDTGVRKVFQIMGYILFVVKIAIPLCLLIFGIINLVKVVVSGEQEGLAKSVKSLGIKAIAAVVIFILPTIIYYIINLVGGSNEGTEVYGYCKTCIFEPKKC